MTIPGICKYAGGANTDSSIPLFIFGIPTLAVGIAFLVNFILGKKMLAKEIEAGADGLDTLSNIEGKENADRNFEHQQLYMALSTLNPKERASVSLYYLSGYSVKEISKITGSSESAVKKQLERGRTQLKNIIGK